MRCGMAALLLLLALAAPLVAADGDFHYTQCGSHPVCECSVIWRHSRMQRRMSIVLHRAGLREPQRPPTSAAVRPPL